MRERLLLKGKIREEGGERLEGWGMGNGSVGLVSLVVWRWSYLMPIDNCTAFGGKAWGRPIDFLDWIRLFALRLFDYICFQLTAFEFCGDWGIWIEKSGQSISWTFTFYLWGSCPLTMCEMF